MDEKKQWVKDGRDHPQQRMLTLSGEGKDAFLAELGEVMERGGLEMDRHVVLRVDQKPGDDVHFVKLTFTANAMGKKRAEVGDVHDLVDGYSGPSLSF